MISLIISFVPTIFTKMFITYWSSIFFQMFCIIIVVSFMFSIFYYFFLPYKRFGEYKKVLIFYIISVISSIILTIIIYNVVIEKEYIVNSIQYKFFLVSIIDIIISNLITFNLLSYLNFGRVRLKKYFVRSKMGFGIFK